MNVEKIRYLIETHKYSIRKVAEYLKISKSKVQRICAKNNIRIVKNKCRGPLSSDIKNMISLSLDNYWNSKRGLKRKTELRKSKIAGTKRVSVTRGRRGKNKYKDFLMRSLKEINIKTTLSIRGDLELPDYKVAVKFAPISSFNCKTPDYSDLKDIYNRIGWDLFIISNKQNNYTRAEFRRFLHTIGIDLVK